MTKFLKPHKGVYLMVLGSGRTISFDEQQLKVMSMAYDEISDYLSRHDYSIINVAGNRESLCSGIQENTRFAVKESLLKYKQLKGLE